MRRLIGLVTLFALLVALPASALAATLSEDQIGAGHGWLTVLALVAVGTLLGTGIIPSGTTGSELSAITRRAFIPSLVVQLYQATPILSAMLANGQTASGGISSITVPVQGSKLTTAQYTDYSGAFNQPSELIGIQDAEMNLKALVVPIPFLGMEGIVQMNAAVIPKIEAKMNDAGNQAASLLATDLATNATNGTTSVDGFPLMASTTTTYGNIDPTTAGNEFWVGNARAEGTIDPTRESMLADIVSAAKANGGEMPNFGVMAPGTWMKAARSFLGLEQYRITPDSNFAGGTQGPVAGFTAFQVAGVPIYMDANFTEGEAYYGNSRYMSAYVHEAAAFAFTGFASTLPNFQLGYVGALVAVLEFVLVKRKAITRCTGYNFDTV